MSQLDEMERRIAAALDRVANALDQFPVGTAAGADPAELEALRSELENERAANAQLEQRLRNIQQRQRERVEKLTADVTDLRNSTMVLDEAVAKARAASAKLLEYASELRDALEQGSTTKDLVDRTLVAEIEALHAARDVDMAEARTLLDLLEPIAERAASRPPAVDQREGA